MGEQSMFEGHFLEDLLRRREIPLTPEDKARYMIVASSPNVACATDWAMAIVYDLAQEGKIDSASSRELALSLL